MNKLSVLTLRIPNPNPHHGFGDLKIWQSFFNDFAASFTQYLMKILKTDSITHFTRNKCFPLNVKILFKWNYLFSNVRGVNEEIAVITATVTYRRKTISSYRKTVIWEFSEIKYDYHYECSSTIYVKFYKFRSKIVFLKIMSWFIFYLQVST